MYSQQHTQACLHSLPSSNAGSGGGGGKGKDKKGKSVDKKGGSGSGAAAAGGGLFFLHLHKMHENAKSVSEAVIKLLDVIRRALAEAEDEFLTAGNVTTFISMWEDASGEVGTGDLAAHAHSHTVLEAQKSVDAQIASSQLVSCQRLRECITASADMLKG